MISGSPPGMPYPRLLSLQELSCYNAYRVTGETNPQEMATIKGNSKERTADRIYSPFSVF